MTCRKNQATLTAAEKATFVNALLTLKNSTPSQMGLASRYDDYVQMHVNSMSGGNSWAHRRSAFLPWHREFLRRFELDLQAIDPSVSLPYWDWTVDNSATSSIWNADFMGGNGRASDGRVMDGAFAFDSGNWTLTISEDGSTDLRRRFGTFPGAASLPTPTQVTDALTVVPYDVAPWNDAASTQPSFRNRSEGWYGGGRIHNLVHLWVSGGTSGDGSDSGAMFFNTSPNDPVFWLHHCNIDRLWALWQRQHPTEGYLPTSGGPLGHNLNDSMQPWAGATTPASTLNHQASGYWYDTDPPLVELITLSLAFTDIPQGVGGTGVKTYRAIVFEVSSCTPITLQIAAGPSAGFELTSLGTSEIVEPSENAQPAIGRLWIAYTSTTLGASITGSVTVRAVETGQTWVVDLTANTVPRLKSAIALVLDRSGSMAEPAGDGNTKIAKLREAGAIFVDLMQQGDAIGIVRYDDTAQRLIDVTDVGPAMTGAGRIQAGNILNGPDLNPGGTTSIGDGVLKGTQALNDAQAVTIPPYDVRALLVLTDGNENTAPLLSDPGVASNITANSFAIGLGTASNVSAAALNTLTQNNNGYLLITGDLTTDQSFRLTKYFLQILAGITNANVILDPQGQLVYGAQHRIPFSVTEADMGMDVIVLCPAPYYLDFQLETPDGQLIDPGQATTESAVEFVLREKVSYYRVSLPALAASAAGSHAGQWYARLSLRKKEQPTNIASVARFDTSQLKSRALPYSLLVHCYSNLQMKATVQQKSFEPGADVLVQVSLSEYDVPVEHRARVWVEVTRPDNSSTTLTLQEQEAGQFRANFTAALPGVYTLRIRASGTTFTGRSFRREQTLTAAVFKGGDSPPIRDPHISDLVDWLNDRDERFCKLVLCLLSKKVISPELRKHLAAQGVSLEALEACLKLYCRDVHQRNQKSIEEVTSMSKLPENLSMSELLAHPEIRKLINAIRHEIKTERGEVEFAERKEATPLFAETQDAHPHFPHFSIEDDVEDDSDQQDHDHDDRHDH